MVIIQYKKNHIDKKRAQNGNKCIKDGHNARQKKHIDKKRDKIGDKCIKEGQNARQTRFIDRKRVESGPVKLRKDIN